MKKMEKKITCERKNEKKDIQLGFQISDIKVSLFKIVR